MSIVTKTGDQGTTGLMFNRRVSKTHPRVEAYGAVDELNAGLGLARASASDAASGARLLQLQQSLVQLMGELATAAEDQARYVRDGFKRLSEADTAHLEGMVAEAEARVAGFKGWAMPGQNGHAAALDLARTICRRAERRVCVLQETGESDNPEVVTYLNRLGDLLWLLARVAELPPDSPPA